MIKVALSFCMTFSLRAIPGLVDQWRFSRSSTSALFIPKGVRCAVWPNCLVLLGLSVTNFLTVSLFHHCLLSHLLLWWARCWWCHQKIKFYGWTRHQVYSNRCWERVKKKESWLCTFTNIKAGGRHFTLSVWGLCESLLRETNARKGLNPSANLME